MEQTSQNPPVNTPADERKAWIKPEMSKLDVESGGFTGSSESSAYSS